MDILLAGLQESPIDLPYVGPGTHEGKSIFGVTVEFTPATTAANFKLLYIKVAFEKKEGIFEFVCVDVGSMENFWLFESLAAGFESIEWRFRFQMERLVSILQYLGRIPKTTCRCGRKPFLGFPIRTPVNIPFLFYFVLIFYMLLYLLFIKSSLPSYALIICHVFRPSQAGQFFY